MRSRSPLVLRGPNHGLFRVLSCGKNCQSGRPIPKSKSPAESGRARWLRMRMKEHARAAVPCEKKVGAALSHCASGCRRAQLCAGREHTASGSTPQRQCCSTALLLVPQRLHRGAARAAHAAGVDVAPKVHTCCAIGGLHTLRAARAATVLGKGGCGEGARGTRQWPPWRASAALLGKRADWPLCVCVVCDVVLGP